MPKNPPAELADRTSESVGAKTPRRTAKGFLESSAREAPAQDKSVMVASAPIRILFDIAIFPI